MPIIDADGRSMYYEEQGEGEPLLLVMGLSADHLSWALQVPSLSAEYRTIIFDNRDVGQSFYADGPYEIADMAQDTLALADALGLDSFHLVGMSMGGAIAQEVALAAPERIRTLTLCVTWGGSGAYAIERSRLWAASVLRTPFEQRVDELLVLTLSEEFFENEQAVEFVRRLTLSNPHPQAAEAFARQVQASGRHETRERLPSLSMPVHVIGAEHDILVPVWKSEEIAELVPGARLTVLERAPHGINIERAEEFNGAVLDFLRAARPAPA